MALNYPPVFVNGVQRSGTTLVIRMLSKSPNIAFFPRETHLFPLLWKVNDSISKFKSGTEFSKFVLENFPKVNNGWTEDQDYLKEIAQSIQNDNFIPSSTTNTLSYLLKHWQNKNPNCMVGEKTPAHIYYAEQIFKEFPNAKFIITVRDPRGIALSEMVKLAQNPRNKANFNLFSFIVRWQTAHNLAKKWQEKFGTEKVKYIKYEDIILQPQQTVLELCNFLEIAFLPEMLEVGVVNSSFLDLKQKDKRFNTENLTRWKEGLSKQQIALIQYHLSSSMKELGYDIEEVDNQLLKSQLQNDLKMKAAELVCNGFPAYFHHLNRNEKYK
ncbi:MAG: sulfotransferase [Bacteroidetes bacterium]|nr:sulfotransferase [Bacteroidota bacterium]MBP7255610.1 sulfotransferase [Chitinophagales bacterium]MBK7138160.1 sulfotransferase [Bacteroidota bacterium]MBK7641113.1 sulfotransferase [Bacteroidota bacterium]MBK8673761.1 sulfotransferase [Bacteroidota bacterium]